jgi:hypothetical protein
MFSDPVFAGGAQKPRNGPASQHGHDYIEPAVPYHARRLGDSGDRARGRLGLGGVGSV